MNAITIILFIGFIGFCFWLFRPKRKNRTLTRPEIIAIPSSSVVEPRIEQMTCSICGSHLRLEQVEGEFVNNEHRRIATTTCVEKNHQERIVFRLEDRE